MVSLVTTAVLIVVQAHSAPLRLQTPDTLRAPSATELTLTPLATPDATPAYLARVVVRPSSSASDTFFLTGLGLTAAGLVLGGAGFAILYACPEGSSCWSPGLETAGWVLAAPGVLPLATGLVMLYISVGGSSHAAVTPPADSRGTMVAAERPRRTPIVGVTVPF